MPLGVVGLARLAGPPIAFMAPPGVCWSPMRLPRMPRRPRLAVVEMARGLAKGTAVDRPRSMLRVIRELRGDTPDDSPLTVEALMERADYRELGTPKVAPGDPAFDFELPRHDFADGTGTPTREMVRLSAFRKVQPVVLIFGSYT